MIVQPDFLDHYKTQMLVDMTGDPAAPLFVLRLWAHCQQRRLARFSGLAPSALKAICRATALEANKLRSILLQCGFIRVEGDLTIVHDWEETNAALFGSWDNGRKGGRPKKEPEKNPRVTGGIPTGNPDETQKEPIREEKSREDPAPPNPQGGNGGGSLSEKEEFWRWACDLIGHPGVHKSRNEQDALYAAPVPSEEDRKLVARYHRLARQEPTKYPKPRQTVIGLIGEFYAEVGKARQALGINTQAVKKPAAMPEEWPAFVEAHYRNNSADLLAWKSLEDGRRRMPDVFDAIWQEFKEWRKTK